MMKTMTALFTALMRLHRRIFYSRLIGDDEIHQTLSDAYRDARLGKFGNWDSWIQFAQKRTQLDSAFFVKHNIKRILIDISIEDFEANILNTLKALSSSATIDILCDQHRASAHQANSDYTLVFDRKPGFLNPLRILPALLLQRYDLVITDANMEARRPSAMCAKQAAIFHNNILYRATRRPIIGAIAHVLSLPVGIISTLLTIKHFRRPFPLGKPPSEAADLLTYIGIDPALGQPYSRLDTND